MSEHKIAYKNIAYKNLDALAAYPLLRECAGVPRTQLSPERIPQCDLPFVGGMRYNYAARLLRDSELTALTALADEAQLIAKYRAVIAGEYVNRSEGRMVLHHLLRGSLLDDGDGAAHERTARAAGADTGGARDGSSNATADGNARGTVVDRYGKDMARFYRDEREKVNRFADEVRSGAVRTGDGSRIEAVVQIGIGGSDLGPRALYEALYGWAVSEQIEPLIPAYFVSNIDPDDSLAVLARIPLHSTLFVLVSKSGSTIETLTNTKIIEQFLLSRGVREPKKHIVVVTAAGSPLAAERAYPAQFFIDNHIGGRYSVSGAVGAVVLSIAFGPEVFGQFLDGAHQADRCALEPDPLHNPPLLDALCGVYERSVLGYPAYAVLPYAQALHRFPAHIQQVDMESNGKSVNRFGEPVDYQTGAIVFGEPGTNGQHSFYQLLHQGSTVVPSIFIAFDEQQRNTNRSAATTPTTVDAECATAQEILRANVVAQISAFARGEENATDPNKQFPGLRPSALLYGQRLTPFALGALLSFFENRVLFQGFLWNINSFDQEGVQLGKRLATAVLNDVDSSGVPTDPLLRNYQQLFSALD